jgi:hypothetical protein
VVAAADPVSLDTFRQSSRGDRYERPVAATPGTPRLHAPQRRRTRFNTVKPPPGLESGMSRATKIVLSTVTVSAVLAIALIAQTVLA